MTPINSDKNVLDEVLEKVDQNVMGIEEETVDDGDISELLGSSDDTFDDDFSDLEDYTPTDEDLEMEKKPQTITVNVDPVSGKINNVLAPEKRFEDLTVEQLLELDYDQIEKDLPIKEENIVDTLQTAFPNFNPSDLNGFLKALDAYRKKEKRSYFNMLPESFKKQIDMIIGTAQIGYASQKEARNYVLEGLFDQIIQDNYLNSMMLDLNKSLEESYKQLYDETKGEFSKYNNNQRYIYETYMLEYADKIQETDPEKADECRKIHDMFVESYTYTKMLDMYLHTGKLRVKKIELEKFVKTCNSWIQRYSNHKMTINNLSDTLPVLAAHFKFSEDTLKRFVIIFTKYAMNMSPDVLNEHVYMYYFIKNILSLNYYNHEDEKESAFYDTVKENIEHFLTEIDKKENKNVEV